MGRVIGISREARRQETQSSYQLVWQIATDGRMENRERKRNRLLLGSIRPCGSLLMQQARHNSQMRRSPAGIEQTAGAVDVDDQRRVIRGGGGMVKSEY